MKKNTLFETYAYVQTKPEKCKILEGLYKGKTLTYKGVGSYCGDIDCITFEDEDKKTLHIFDNVEIEVLG